MIERDADLGVLSAAIAGAGTGAGGLVVIEGPPGIGKSALLGAAGGGRGARHRGCCLRAAGLARAPLGFGGRSQAADSERSGAHGLYWGPADLDDVAESTGAADLQRERAERYRQDRESWRARLRQYQGARAWPVNERDGWLSLNDPGCP